MEYWGDEQTLQTPPRLSSLTNIIWWFGQA